MIKLYIKGRRKDSLEAQMLLARAGVHYALHDVTRSRKDVVTTPLLVDGPVECVGLKSIAGYAARALDKTNQKCYTAGA